MNASLLTVGILALSGCGQVLGLDERQCPCGEGWHCVEASQTCESTAELHSYYASGFPTDAAIVCPGLLDLGTQEVPDDTGAAAATVTGLCSSVLTNGERQNFKYQSAWPQLTGWGLDGWVLQASKNQEFTFTVAAVTDEAGTTPLPIVVYGPIAGTETPTWTARSATALSGKDVPWALLDGGPSLPAGDVRWTATEDGIYFVAPLYEVTHYTNGSLIYPGLDDNRLSKSFIVAKWNE